MNTDCRNKGIQWSRLAVVTPAKDELANLPRLFASVENQSVPVSLWIIVDDNSTDGSSDYLAQQSGRLKNVETLKVVRRDDLAPAYGLGVKYASVVQAGLQALKSYESAHSCAFDFIGLLDADIFPEPNYFKNLLSKFALLPRLGIASGRLFCEMQQGLTPDRMPRRWPRGGLRVWRRSCLEAAPYLVAPSADAVSAARAWLAGWHCQAFDDSTAVTREMGIRSNPKYYGFAAARLHIPYYCIIPRCFWKLFRDGRQEAWNFYLGYVEERRTGARAELPSSIARYFQLYPFHIFRETWIAWWNQRRVVALERSSGG